MSLPRTSPISHKRWLVKWSDMIFSVAKNKIIWIITFLYSVFNIYPSEQSPFETISNSELIRNIEEFFDDFYSRLLSKPSIFVLVLGALVSNSAVYIGYMSSGGNNATPK